jgi:DNA-directed RNA polymerase subunit alpha
MGVRMRDFAMPGSVIVDEKSYSPTYGKFVVEPFERGYGITIGNSLRRVLISSIEGSAVTSIKINGVFHEFSTIPGVLEDVSEIILNIKGLVLRLHSRTPKTIMLKAEKKGEIKAKNIVCDENVEVINLEHHIATLTAETKLNIEMEVARGRGYVPAERNKKEDMPVGVIAIDSIFSPVKKVNFQVENTRVGQITNYDRLILEIWTNGSVEPKEALVYASYILQRHYDVFSTLGKVEEEEEEEKGEEIDYGLLDKLKMPITELELSVRSENCLKEADIKTLWDLVKHTEPELLKHRNFGKKSLQELVGLLNSMDLSFGMEIPDEIRKRLEEEKS